MINWCVLPFLVHQSISSFSCLQVDRVSVTAEGGAGGRPARPGGGAMRIHRHFPFPANQMYVVVLHRELKPMRVYRLNVSFDAAIEDELLGFFRSSYTLQRERRYTHWNAHTPTHTLIFLAAAGGSTRKGQSFTSTTLINSYTLLSVFVCGCVCVALIKPHKHPSLTPYEFPIILCCRVVSTPDFSPHGADGETDCVLIHLLFHAWVCVCVVYM